MKGPRNARSALRGRSAVAKRAVVRSLKALSPIVGIPLRALSGLVRRDEHLLVFGGNAGRFSDNGRYLFLGLADQPVFRCVWITGKRSVRDEIRSMGFEAEMRWSPGGVRACLRAGWY